MSDHFIAVIPRSPLYLPSAGQAEAAQKILRELAPQSDEITFRIEDGVRFYDCGTNFESVACPFCHSILSTKWWGDRMSEDFGEGGFRLGVFKLPCCGAETTLNDLEYDSEQGLYQFVLEAMNPNILGLQPMHIQHLENLLGTAVRVIYRHI